MRPKYKKKSQGEIFGIALFFVIIIVGIILYGRIKAFSNLDETSQSGEKYKLLAEGTLNTILKMSTGCEVERDKDTIKDLINFCLDTTNINEDPEIPCEDESGGYERKNACRYSKELINQSLYSLYGNNSIVGMIPFELTIDLPNQPGAIINTEDGEISNLKKLFNIETKTQRIKSGLKKAPSGRIAWATSRRNINFDLYLYYR